MPKDLHLKIALCYIPPGGTRKTPCQKLKEDLKIVNIPCDNAEDAVNDQNHRKILANVLCIGPNDDDDGCNGARGSNIV